MKASKNKNQFARTLVLTFLLHRFKFHQILILQCQLQYLNTFLRDLFLTRGFSCRVSAVSCNFWNSESTSSAT